MELRIVNLLGMKDAKLALEGIVEAVGSNASGKTSLATCAQALLAHEANPLGVPATQSKRVYSHDGDPDGYATLLGAEWRPAKDGLTIRPANAERPSHPGAVGLIDFTARLGEKTRLASLEEALLPDPETIIDQVDAKLREYLPDNDLKGVLTMIRQQGFEAAAATYAERGRAAKRQWETITGKRYGVRLAADWRPDNWTADMDTMTAGQAQETTAAAREALGALHKVQAVSVAEVEAAQAAVASMPALRQVEDDAAARNNGYNAELAALPLDKLRADFRQAERDLAGWRKQDVAIGALLCPVCGGELAVGPDGSLEVVLIENEEKRRKEAQAKVGKLEVKLANKAEALEEVEQRVKRIQELITRGTVLFEDARTALAVAKRQSAQADAVVDTEQRRADLAEAEQTAEDAKVAEEMVSAEAKAGKLTTTIARYGEVSRAIGEKGVRRELIAAQLRRVNAGLAVIQSETGWPVVSIDDKGLVRWGERPVAMCSESERWRAQAAIQLTIAALTGSKAVVLDRADLLDPDNRAMLVRAVMRVQDKVGLDVLLCSTGKASSNAPWRQVELDAGVIA